MQVEGGFGRGAARALVRVVLFAVGVIAMLVLGPLLTSWAAGSSLTVGQFYIGWTAGLALVLIWEVARLHSGGRTGWLASTVVVAAIFYVFLTGTTYVAAINYAPSVSHQATAGTVSGVWFAAAVLMGLAAALLASTIGGLVLWRLGRLRAAAILPGIVVGMIGVVFGYMAFIDLYQSTL